MYCALFDTENSGVKIMYDIISEIIKHNWNSSAGGNTTEQQLIYYICGTLIIVLTAVFIDLIYRVFRHFWR